MHVKTLFQTKPNTPSYTLHVTNYHHFISSDILNKCKRLKTFELLSIQDNNKLTSNSHKSSSDPQHFILFVVITRIS